ncbi:MAG: hypothetical protein ACTHMV_05460 [Chitinophagaceae bacterium]
MNPLFIYFIGISFLASLTVYFFSKPAALYLRLFPPFLLISLVVELSGMYYSRSGRANTLQYNFFSVFEFCFYLFVLSQVISNAKMKKAVWITTGLYALTATINILFIQGKDVFHTITYALGCLLIVIFCIYYFWELFRLPKSVKLQKNPAFWICSGLLFYFCCGFPLFGLINYLVSVSTLLRNNFFTIVTILNIFLYSLFTIGFLCRIRIRKYTSLQ